MVAALASFLDARAVNGKWLVRMEDLDAPRMVAGADRVILGQLRQLGMHWDSEICYQSRRSEAYQTAFDRLSSLGLIYPCACTRREIADSVLVRHGVFPGGERPYPGTCRQGIKAGRQAKSWRVRIDPGVVTFDDRWSGRQTQDVQQAVGDFVVKRADGQWAYQLAVVVDDAWQGVTDVIRGSDLLSSTARQIVLGRLLSLPSLRYMHIPVLMDDQGRKLSKQNGAPAADTSNALALLEKSWCCLGFTSFGATDVQSFFSGAIARWANRLHSSRLAPS